MHITNAHRIARSPSNETLQDIFQATGALGSYLQYFPNDAQSRYLSRSEADEDLTALVGKLDHSEKFKQLLTQSFDTIAEWLLYDNDFPEKMKYWDRLSTRDRMLACTVFNLVAVQNLRDIFRAPLSNIEAGPIYAREIPDCRTMSMTRAEDYAVAAFMTGPQEQNRIAVNTYPNAGFSDAYETMKNLAAANIYLLMQTMIHDALYRWRPAELEQDKLLWEGLKKYNGYVPDQLQTFFHAQFFRRAWEPAIGKMADTLKQGVDAMELAPPPSRTVVQRLAGMFGYHF